MPGEGLLEVTHQLRSSRQRLNADAHAQRRTHQIDGGAPAIRTFWVGAPANAGGGFFRKTLRSYKRRYIPTTIPMMSTDLNSALWTMIGAMFELAGWNRMRSPSG
jgi:hypothetical protein